MATATQNLATADRYAPKTKRYVLKNNNLCAMLESSDAALPLFHSLLFFLFFISVFSSIVMMLYTHYRALQVNVNLIMPAHAMANVSCVCVHASIVCTILSARFCLVLCGVTFSEWLQTCSI